MLTEAESLKETDDLEAEAHGYPCDWLKLYGSIEDPTFEVPLRSSTRPVTSLDEA